jgi:guanylate kinase
MPDLWLSRSWTTRARRPSEPEDAYVFATRAQFEARVAAGGFLEWAEFLDNLYGTPVVEAPAGHDVLLEIDVAGARQVLDAHPDATVVLLVPPSAEVQRQRLVARGDDEGHVRRRLSKGEEETRIGHALAGENVVVNDEVDRAVAQVGGIVDRTRAARRAPGVTPGTGQKSGDKAEER